MPYVLSIRGVEIRCESPEDVRLLLDQVDRLLPQLIQGTTLGGLIASTTPADLGPEAFAQVAAPKVWAPPRRKGKARRQAVRRVAKERRAKPRKSVGQLIATQAAKLRARASRGEDPTSLAARLRVRITALLGANPQGLSPFQLGELLGNMATAKDRSQALFKMKQKGLLTVEGDLYRLAAA